MSSIAYAKQGKKILEVFHEKQSVKKQKYSALIWQDIFIEFGNYGYCCGRDDK